ncbi:MAG: DUF5618 family protein [Nitrospirae bacterium]|nr:DUF5618 family protein [Nitrospirota bacterium]
MAKRHVTQDGDAFRYLENARQILKGVPIEGHIYTDRKPVREAFGTAYLAILEAINEVLLKKGLTAKRIHQSVDAYRDALQNTWLLITVSS